MSLLRFCKVACLSFLVCACASDGRFDVAKATAVGAGVLQAAALDENTVKQAASLSAKELDGKHKVAPISSNYVTRLQRITRNIHHYDGLILNFKVYLAKDINAFAMADGTVRIYSGLLDAMPDDQVLAVIGHEIGHVKLKHSYRQMREKMLTSTAFQAVIAVGGTVGKLTSSELGAIAYQAVTARYSQKDELESDVYSVNMLRALGKDPAAMLRSIETLERHYGSGGGLLNSHPSNSKRKSELRKILN